MIKDILKIGALFVIIDSFYLYSMKDNFNDLVKSIQGSNLKLEILPTIFCYLFLIGSIYYFLIYKKGDNLDAFLLGFFIYGVYETTNLAIFKKWNYKIALIDTLWGGILFYLTTYFTYNIKTRNGALLIRSAMNFLYTMLVYPSKFY